jgi:hypothetical protein
MFFAATLNRFSHAAGTVFAAACISVRESRSVLEPIELARVAEQGASPLVADVGDDLRDALLGLAVAIALRPEQAFTAACRVLNDLIMSLAVKDRLRSTVHRPPYTTILFSGYSTIPWPPPPSASESGRARCALR